MVKKIVNDVISKELERKFVHIIIGMSLIFIGIKINTIFGLMYLKLFLLALTLICLLIDFLIADMKWKIPIYERLQRKHEEQGLHAHTYALFAILILFEFVDISIIIAATSMLVFGDAAAAIVGRVFGKHLISETKTWEGTIAMLIVSMLSGSFVLGFNIVSIFTAIAATIAEASVNKVNDGVSIPLVAGLVGQLISMFLKYL